MGGWINGKCRLVYPLFSTVANQAPWRLLTQVFGGSETRYPWNLSLLGKGVERKCKVADYKWTCDASSCTWLHLGAEIRWILFPWVSFFVCSWAYPGSSLDWALREESSGFWGIANTGERWKDRSRISQPSGRHEPCIMMAFVRICS